MEGNTLIDCIKEPRRGNKCGWCNGTGKLDWTEARHGMDSFTDALDMRVYKRRKYGNPVESFSELMKIARAIKEEGCECHYCDGTGEVYDE